METKKRQPTEKMKITSQWVSGFILSNDYPPTYKQVAEYFDISKTAAYMRLKYYRNEMRERK